MLSEHERQIEDSARQERTLEEIRRLFDRYRRLAEAPGPERRPGVAPESAERRDEEVTPTGIA